jgi:hypothetical protein
MMPFFECFRSALELWLDQREQMRRGGGNRQHRWQDQLERNEADIDHNDVGTDFEPLARERANVGFFHRNNSGISVQAGMQLSVPDIDGVDEARAIGEQDFGETAGRSADIDADMILDVDGILIQRAGKFDAAARHPGMRGFCNDLGIIRKGFRCFRDLLAIGNDAACFDSGLRPRTAFEQAALNQQDVCALAFGHFLPRRALPCCCQASFTVSVLTSLPSASNTLATMPLESRPACAYIAAGES